MIERLIYGGSFNPIHKGHLATIEYVLNHEICKEIFIIPTYQSPFKNKNYYATAELRFTMVEKAISSYFSKELQKKIVLSDIEIKDQTINYTVNTLKSLQDNTPTGILIGADGLETLHLWKEIEWILENYTFFIISRYSYPLEKQKKEIEKIKSMFPKSQFITIEFYPPNCSSSEIRRKIMQCVPYENLRDCLCEEVYNFIIENSLYQN